MTKHQLCQYIVNNTIKGQKNWPKEIKIAKQLIELHPDEEFWLKLKKDFSLYSLAYFLTQDGKEILNNHNKLYKLDIQKTEHIINNDSVSSEKLGEDKKFTPSTKTLLEFLKK